MARRTPDGPHSFWLRRSARQHTSVSESPPRHTEDFAAAAGGQPGRYDAIDGTCPARRTCRHVASRNPYEAGGATAGSNVVTDWPGPAQIRETSEFEMLPWRSRRRATG